MAFVAEVKARLGLDTTDFERGLTKTSADLGKIGGDINRKLRRSFGADDVFKGLLQGLGIGSVQQVVDFITKGFSDAADKAKSIAESTAETLGIYEKIFSSRRTDQQNLDANLREQAKLQKELAGEQDRKVKVQVWNPFMQKFLTEDREVLGNAERRNEIAKRLAELSAEESTIRKKFSDEDRKAREQTAADRFENAKRVAEIEQQARRKEMDAAQEIADLEKERSNLAATIALSGDEDLSRAVKLKQIEADIADKKRQQAEASAKEAKEREQLLKREAKAIEGVQDAQVEAFATLRDMSSATLQEIASGKSGNPTDRAQAREVIRLRSRAKRVRGMTDMRDAAGNRIDSGVMADQLISRSNEIAKGISSLGYDERDPLGNARTHIEKSMQYLEDIRDQLKPSATK